jgi:hypothetical protein
MTTDFMPKTKLGKWAMYLGLPMFLIPPFLGIFASIIRPIIDRASSEKIGSAIGFGVGIAVFALSISALIVGIRAFKQGERALGFWIGFIPAILAGAFWIFMIIGEFLFPH